MTKKAIALLAMVSTIVLIQWVYMEVSSMLNLSPSHQFILDCVAVTLSIFMGLYNFVFYKNK